MTDEELLKWSDRVRAMFRGEMDEMLFTLARGRIKALSFNSAWSALDDYAIAHGGARSRFIPGKFLEFYAIQRRIDGTQLEAIRRQTQADAEYADRTGSERQIARETEQQKRIIVQATESRRAEAIRLLGSYGWGAPPSDLERWPRSWLIAVSDLISEAELVSRCPETGLWTIPTGAREFYRRAGRPQETPQEARQSLPAPAGPESRPAPRSAPEGDGAAYTAALRSAMLEAQEADEIPF